MNEDYVARIKMEALVADALRAVDDERKATCTEKASNKQITLSITLPSLPVLVGAFLAFTTVNSVLVGIAVAFLVNGG